jgi:hypothetical protein
MLIGKVPPNTMPVGAIVGGTVGGAIAITAIIAIGCYMVRRKSRPPNTQMQNAVSPISEWNPNRKSGFNVAGDMPLAPVEDQGRPYRNSRYQNDERIASGRLSSHVF